MKSYRAIAVALFVLLSLTVVARRAQFAPGPAESRSDLLAQATTGQSAQPQSAQPQPARIPATQAPPGSSGPATELLKMMAVDRPDFGIKVAQTFDASGKPAYETKGGDLLFFTNASVSYNSTADKPMVIVIDAKARKMIAVGEIDMPSTPHGITLSPDGKLIYATVRPGVNRDSSGHEIDGWRSKINAETMQEVGAFPVPSNLLYRLYLGL